MAIQVSYPGVYIDEYAPAAPIEGVSTSIAAFIGIAERGRSASRTWSPAWTPSPRVRRAGRTPRRRTTCRSPSRASSATAARRRTSSASARPSPRTPTSQSRDAAPLTSRRSSAIADGAGRRGRHGHGRPTPARWRRALTAAGAGTASPCCAARTDITAIDPTRRQVTVADAATSPPGDQVVLAKGGTNAAIDGRRRATRRSSGSPRPCAGQHRLRGRHPDAPPTPAPATTALRLDVPAGGQPARGRRRSARSVQVTDGTTTEWGVAADGRRRQRHAAAPARRHLRPHRSPPRCRPPSSTSRSPTPDGHHAHVRRAVDLADPPALVGRRAVGRPLRPGRRRPRPSSRPATRGRPPAPRRSPARSPTTRPQSWAKVATDIDPAPRRCSRRIDEISIVAVPGCTDVDRPAGGGRALRAACSTGSPSSTRRRASTCRRSRRSGQALTGTLDKGFAALYYPWITVKDPRPQRRSSAPAVRARRRHLRAGPTTRAACTRRRRTSASPARSASSAGSPTPSRASSTSRASTPSASCRAAAARSSGAPARRAGDRNWQYVNIRRLFLYLEESIQEGSAGPVFEPNDLALWQKLRRTITEFLTRIWRDGALFGETAEGGVLRAHRRGAQPAVDRASSAGCTSRSASSRSTRPSSSSSASASGTAAPRSPSPEPTSDAREEARMTAAAPDPFVNFNFLVEIDGIARGAFQEVTGLDSTIDVIEHREGGENTTPRKLAGQTKHANIVLKWGMTIDNQLFDWHQDGRRRHHRPPQRLDRAARPPRHRGRALELRPRLAQQVHRARRSRPRPPTSRSRPSSSPTRAWSG